jgi:hypothetical protein
MKGMLFSYVVIVLSDLFKQCVLIDDNYTFSFGCGIFGILL